MSILIKKQVSEAWQALIPKKISAHEVVFNNSVASWFYFPAKDNEGLQYRLNLLRVSDRKSVVIQIDLLLADCEVTLEVDEGAMSVMLNDMVPERYLSKVPLSLIKVIFINKLSMAVDFIESQAGYSVDILRFALLDKKKTPEKDSICWEVSQDNIVKGCLWLCTKNNKRTIFKRFLSKLNYQRSPTFFTNYPVMMSSILGCLWLSSEQLSLIEMGDVLLLRDPANGDKATSKLTVPPCFIFSAIFEKNRLIVQGKLESNVSKVSEINKDKINLEEVLMEVSFELGRKQISFAEINSIGPGYIVELDKESVGLVNILVNGANIGAGEIVQVGNRSGVRVLELSDGVI